jgi:hypothetical protein
MKYTQKKIKPKTEEIQRDKKYFSYFKKKKLFSGLS